MARNLTQPDFAVISGAFIHMADWVTRVEANLERMNTGIDEMNQQVRNMNTHMERLDGRMDRFEGRMNRFEGRMDRFEGRMDRFEGRMDRFEGRMDKLQGRIDSLELPMRSGYVPILCVKEDEAREPCLLTRQRESKAVAWVGNSRSLATSSNAQMEGVPTTMTDLENLSVTCITEMLRLLGQSTGGSPEEELERLRVACGIPMQAP
ncbi:hypothetical protein F4802DRAFT_357044 [Xylaria palmicola]|nr:hypothetical protein F4802DRAFT_357044 [Xylaria palmicola]